MAAAGLYGKVRLAPLVPLLPPTCQLMYYCSAWKLMLTVPAGTLCICTAC